MKSGSSLQRRSANGSVFWLTLAVILGILAALFIWILDFVRMLGSHQEQVTAIEAAALAASRDLSQIVIEDANLGFVSLSDFPPNGTATKAGDNYYLPVRSINTLFATVRLNMIMADKLDDNVMRELAKRDYDLTRLAAANLSAALKNSITPQGSAKDKDGNTITPLQSAINAYNANQVRMSRGKSSLVPGSMKLSLGVVDSLVSNTRIPQPPEYAECTADQQSEKFYKAFVNVPYQGREFVFAAVGDRATLVDYKQFNANPNNLPYFVPSVVKCEADQEYVSPDRGGSMRRIVHAVACAQPGSTGDHRPTPGALAISFPSGPVPELNSLSAIFNSSQLGKAPVDETQSPRSGDAPPAAFSIITLPVLDNPRPPLGHALRFAFYDWIRRCGSQLNVRSLLNALNTTFPSLPGPHRVLIQASASGDISMKAEPIAANYALYVSHNQWSAASGMAFASTNGSLYDVLIKDFVFQAGRQMGGIHAGEPLGPARVGTGDYGGAQSATLGDNTQTAMSFPTGPAAGEQRPTYTTTGIAVDIKFRKR